MEIYQRSKFQRMRNLGKKFGRAEILISQFIVTMHQDGQVITIRKCLCLDQIAPNK